MLQRDMVAGKQSESESTAGKLGRHTPCGFLWMYIIATATWLKLLGDVTKRHGSEQADTSKN